MDWITNLRGRLVCLDTAPIIYYVEEHPVYFPIIAPFFTALAQHEFRAVTSIISLAEVLVHPFQSGDIELGNNYRALLLGTDEITTVSVNQAIAERTASLRSTYRIRTPDAIQIATAIHMGATVVVTNDDRLPRLSKVYSVVLKRILNTPGGA